MFLIKYIGVNTNKNNMLLCTKYNLTIFILFVHASPQQKVKDAGVFAVLFVRINALFSLFLTSFTFFDFYMI